MNNISLSHPDSGSEIPEGSYVEAEATSDLTQVFKRIQSATDQVMECLREAAGESLSLKEISDETGLAEKIIRRVLRKALDEDAETREVFEDENETGSYFLTEPMLDRLTVV